MLRTYRTAPIQSLDNLDGLSPFFLGPQRTISIISILLDGQRGAQFET